MPIWQLQLLIRQMPTIQAAEQLRDINTAMMPHVKAEARTSFIGRLTRTAQRYTVKPRREQIAVIEHNPAKAAEWFAQRGIVVKSRD